MQCPKCHFENREGAKFCIECGCKLEIAYPACGNVSPPAAKFCESCGHPLALSGKPALKEISVDDKLAKIQRYLPPRD